MSPGVHNLTETQWTHVMKMPPKNSNSDKYEPMWEKTRTLLRDFYRPFNQKLATLLEDDRYLWLPKEAPAKSAVAGVEAVGLAASRGLGVVWQAGKGVAL